MPAQPLAESHKYSLRSKFVEGVTFADKLEIQVATYYVSNHDTWPTSFEELGFAPNTDKPPIVERVSIAPKGAIELVFGSQIREFSSKSVFFSPSVNKSGRIIWQCWSRDVDEIYLSKRCRANAPVDLPKPPEAITAQTGNAEVAIWMQKAAELFLMNEAPRSSMDKEFQEVLGSDAISAEISECVLGNMTPYKDIPLGRLIAKRRSDPVSLTNDEKRALDEANGGIKRAIVECFEEIGKRRGVTLK